MRNIRIDVDGAVGTITIDRRERFNSLDVETARDLRKAGLQLARDTSIRAVVLRGEGGVFCSGADLKYIREGGDHAGLSYLQPAARFGVAGRPSRRWSGRRRPAPACGPASRRP